MASVTFSLELNNRANKAGLHVIFVKIRHGQDCRRVSTGIFIKLSDWNKEKKEVRKSCKDYALYNILLKKKLNEAALDNVKNDISEKRVSLDTIKKNLKKEVTGGSFFDFAEKFISKMTNSGTRRVYQSVVNKLREFVPRLDFLDITRAFILEYEGWLVTTKGNKPNTLYKNLGTLRAIYNEAVEQEVFEPSKSPWARIKLKKEASDRTKLSQQEIELIQSTVIDTNLVMFHARNIFLMQYYSFGMRIGDMLQIRWCDFDGERFSYKAGKTDKKHGPKLPPQAFAILAYYQDKPHKRTEYIFPFLKVYEFADHEHFRREIESKTSMVNNNIKALIKLLNIKKNVSTHVARHSFADNARKKTKDIYAISKALGHSSISVTEAYFANDITYENDSLSELVY